MSKCSSCGAQFLDQTRDAIELIRDETPEQRFAKAWKQSVKNLVVTDKLCKEAKKVWPTLDI